MPDHHKYEMIDPDEKNEALDSSSEENEDGYQAPKSLAALKRMTEQALEITRENAELCKRDRDYYDGYQISESQRSRLEERGQPALAINKIAPAVNGLLGLLDNTDTVPEALPRTYEGQNAADVVTKTLRYLADKGKWQNVKRTTSENFFIEGCCAAALEFENDYVKITRIRWDEFIYDPLTREHDFSDASYLGVGKLMDRDDVLAMFGEDAVENTPDGVQDFSFFNDDAAKSTYWTPVERHLIRVCEIYYRVGSQWHRMIFTANEILFAGESDYHDDDGESICPIAAGSFEVDRGGNRYGCARNYISSQDDVNARRSRFLHLTNHRQVKQTALNAPSTHRSIAVREAAKADGAIPFGWEPVPTQDMAQSQWLIYQEASADLAKMAPSPALLGRQGGANESGRARQVLQQSGMTEMARQFARFEAFEQHVYRMLWFMAREYLSSQTTIRLTDDPRSVSFLQINEPVLGPVPKPVINPQTGQPVINPMTGQPAMQMVMGQVGVKNELAKLDMDVTISTVPNPGTLAAETFQQLLEYASATSLSPFSPEFAAILEIAPLPNKEEAIAKIQAAMAQSQQNQQPDPVAQAEAQLGIQKTQSEIALHTARANKDNAAAQLTTTQAAIEAHRAITGQDAASGATLPAPDPVTLAINYAKGQAEISAQNARAQKDLALANQARTNASTQALNSLFGPRTQT